MSGFKGEMTSENTFIKYKSLVDFIYNWWTVSSLKAGKTFYSLIVSSLLSTVSDMQQTLLDHKKKGGRGGEKKEGWQEESKEEGGREERGREEKINQKVRKDTVSVSYTHLTLPTIRA